MCCVPISALTTAGSTDSAITRPVPLGRCHAPLLSLVPVGECARDAAVLSTIRRYAHPAVGHPGIVARARITLLLASRGMAAAALAVSRMRPALTWRALDGDLVAGEVSARLRPDNRWFLYFDTWRADAYPPLADAVACDLGRDLYVTLEDAEYDALDACAQAGFAVHRRESYYRIPADRAVAGLAGAVLPAGLDVLSAADADITRLRLLDDALRQDVPGSAGWRWDAEQFRAETFGPFFDPATYLVAVDRASGEYAALVRIWRNRAGPRLGLIATRPVPAARGRQGAARPGVRRARRAGRYERNLRGRRHKRRVGLVADRTRRTTIRRQRLGAANQNQNRQICATHYSPLTAAQTRPDSAIRNSAG